MRAVDMLRVQALVDCLERTRAHLERTRAHLDYLEQWFADEDDDDLPRQITTTFSAAVDDIDRVLGDDALLAGPRQVASALIKAAEALVEGDWLMAKGQVRAA